MNSKIVHSAFVLLVAASLPFATSLKCYTCSSLSKQEDCAMLKDMEPTECSSQVLTTVSHLPFPNDVRSIFELDNYNLNMQNPEWSCVKLEIGGMPPGNSLTNYTIRTCQITNSGVTDFCTTAKSKLKNSNNNNQQKFMVQFCEGCKTDACNGASSITISLPILAIFALASYFKA